MFLFSSETSLPRAGASILLCLLLYGCSARETATDVVWAVNVGGPAYQGVDGTSYVGDVSIRGGASARMEFVKGSQDPSLYRSYRHGDIRVAHPVAAGTYDLTLHFAEPDEVGPGARVFDVLVEGRTVLGGLDVMLARDSKVHSALTVTVPNIAVEDGELNIAFDPVAGEAVLSAVVLRNKQRAQPSWVLAWSDEFDAASELDLAKWTIDEWHARKVNDEDQAYTARPENLRLANGMLVIEAHKEDFAGAAYTSGRIHSAGKGDILYGRVEVRAKLPEGRGTWPAIWMLPSDPYRYATSCEDGEEWQGSATCDAWPNSGEIDIMEHVGYQMNHVHGTVHNRAYYWINWEQRKGRIVASEVANQFHVYAVEWTPERIDVLLDDTVYFSYLNEHTGWESWPFDHPFHLILNVAVGGFWGRAAGGIDDAIFPQQMLIDYVRVYRLPD